MTCFTDVFILARCQSEVISACESSINAPANWVIVTPIHPSPSLKADGWFDIIFDRETIGFLENYKMS